MDLSYSTATELAAALRERTVSSRELLAHQLDRIEARNPQINAVVHLDLDAAQAAAAEADAETAAGRSRGPLHGLPMTVKDVFEVAGMVTTAGAPELADHVPRDDAVTVSRLREAGAIIIGKTNTPLYAGDDQTFNEVYGVTNNPWDTARSPGGSSGGSAAAVAAGLSPLELGSDIGGSIRAPSHFCGVYGLKGSWGTVPSRGHIPGPPGSLVEVDVNYCGPIARSVADLELAHGVLAGPLAQDAPGWSLRFPAPEERGPIALEGLRIAASFEDPGFPVSAEVAEVLDGFASCLSDAGAQVVSVPLPVPLADLQGSWRDLVLPIIGAGLPDEAFEAFAAMEVSVGDSAAELAMAAMVSRCRDRQAADQLRQEQRQAWAEHFEHHDLVLAPAFAVAAFEHDHRILAARDLSYDGRTVSHFDLIAWCGGIGSSLLPVVSLPAGRTQSGLPVGIQVIGPWLEDRRLLALASELDGVTEGFVRPPGF